MIKLKIKKLNPDAILPSYAHKGDAGLDLFSLEEHTLKPKERHCFVLGFTAEFNSGYAVLIWDKSGLAAKYGVKTMAGVIAALQEAERWNREDLIVITLGVDDLGKTQIREGVSDAGVAFFPEKYGEYIIPAACAILEGAPVPSHMYIENEIITKDNIDRFYPI